MEDSLPHLCMSDLRLSYAFAGEFLHRDAITHQVENIYYVALDGESLLTPCYSTMQTVAFINI